MHHQQLCWCIYLISCPNSRNLVNQEHARVLKILCALLFSFFYSMWTSSIFGFVYRHRHLLLYLNFLVHTCAHFGVHSLQFMFASCHPLDVLICFWIYRGKQGERHWHCHLFWYVCFVLPLRLVKYVLLLGFVIYWSFPLWLWWWVLDDGLRRCHVLLLQKVKRRVFHYVDRRLIFCYEKLLLRCHTSCS